jgi:hypothetical protein
MPLPSTSFPFRNNSGSYIDPGSYFDKGAGLVLMDAPTNAPNIQVRHSCSPDIATGTKKVLGAMNAV